MVYSFENGIPAGIVAVNSAVRTDGEHYRDGVQSLRWEMSGEMSGSAELILRGPVEYRHFRPGGLNQDRCCFVVWLYREKEGEETLRFSFYKQGRECCHFDFGQRFRGWRTCWVPFRDMEGAPEEGMDEIRLNREGDGKECIWLDQLITSVPIDPRHPVPDLQVPFVNPSVDRAVNAHWTSLLRFYRLEQADREKVLREKAVDAPHAEEKLRGEIRLIEERMEQYFLGIYRLNPGGMPGKPGPDSAPNAAELWKQYSRLQLRWRENGLYSGAAVDAVHHRAAYPKEDAERLKLLTGAVGIRECGELLLRTAYLWHEGNGEEKREAARRFEELLRHLWEQGWAAGSSLGTTHHMGYLMRELYVAVFLMRKPLREAGLLGETADMTGWFSGRGRIFREAEELRGESTDTLNTLLQGILCSILLTEDEDLQVCCLKAFRDWLSVVLKPAPGLKGPYKADGSVFHHAGHYPAYAVGGFQGAAPVVYALSGTRFALGEEAHKTMRNALLCMRLYCNRYHWPVSMSARHPRGVGEMSGITDLRPFYYMALAGAPGAGNGEEREEHANARTFGLLSDMASNRAKGPQNMEDTKNSKNAKDPQESGKTAEAGELPADEEMAGALLRLAEYQDFPPAEELRRRGYRAERAPEGHFVMNYACAGIHRRGERMACVRGHSRYLWGNETYEKNNLYGRYITYGNLQILGSGTPVNNRDSGFVQEGWDWNHFPGTTSVVLPWEELRQRVCVVDSTAGFEEMLLSDETFAGGVSFEGRQGCFGMKLHGHAKYDGSLRARKSWFFFEDRIVCLGSGVEDGREQYETVTTLYQHWLGDELSGEIPGQNQERNPAENNVCGSGEEGGQDAAVRKVSGLCAEGQGAWESAPGGSPLCLRDPSGNEYVIPAGQRVVVTRGVQESRMQDTGEPSFARYEKAWLDHGRAPQGAEYEYMIRLPGMEEAGEGGVEQKSGREMPYEVLCKDRTLHAVYDRETGIYAYVFFEAGNAPERGGGMIQSTDTPCLLMERRQGEELRISFCDPDLRLYEGQEPDQLDENGRQKEVSLYSRTWLKNESIGKWSTVRLRGRWRLSGETVETEAEGKVQVKVQVKGDVTEVSFRGRDGAGREVTLCRG